MIALPIFIVTSMTLYKRRKLPEYRAAILAEDAVAVVKGVEPKTFPYPAAGRQKSEQAK